MWEFKMEMKNEGRGFRSRVRTAWNTDLWAGPVPVVKATATLAAAIVGVL